MEMVNSLLIIGGPLLILGAVEVVFGFFCLSRAKRTNLLPLYSGTAALASGIYSASIAIAYIRASSGLDYSFYYRLGWIGWLNLPLFLSLVYALRGHIPKFAKYVLGASYIFWLVVLYFNITTDLIDIEPPSFVPYVDAFGPWEMILRGVGTAQLIWFIALVVVSYKGSRGYKRQQMGYVLLGCVIFAAGGIIISGAPGGKLYFDPGLASYFSLPWIALTLYAVLRHRLFDLRMVVSQIISACILIVVFSAFHLFAVSAFTQILGASLGLTVASLLTAIVAFASPVVGFIKKWINRLVLKRPLDYQTALKQSSEALVSILNLEDLLRKFIEVARKTLGIENAAFYLYDGKKYMLRYAVGEGSQSENMALNPESLIVDQVTKSRQVLIYDEGVSKLTEGELKKIQTELAYTGAEAVVPVYFKDVLCGFLTLGTKSNRDAFLQEDIDFLETLASQAALAIENARLFAEATTDGLTGLYHQKYFKARIRSEYERAARHRHNLILLLIDIDFFKKINDTYGHLTGDNILKGVAKIVHNSFRIEDLCARYGGEEFAVLLNEPNASAAKEVAERIRKRVENHEFDKGIRITISIGMYVYDQTSNCQSELDIIQNADEALYKAKNSGRNRVVYFEEVSKIRLVK